MSFWKKNAEIEQRQKIIDYKTAFGTEFGKRVFMDILNRNFVLNTHKGDAFSEGRRAAALDIMQMCQINLAEFDRLTKEGDFE